MGHINAGIFQAYMNERIQCDVQAAFLGRPSADALLKSISHMSRDVDSRAPTELTDDQKNSLKTHPLIVELRGRRDAISAEAQRMYGTLENAKKNDPKIYALYRGAQAQFDSTKKSLEREKKQETRLQFFDRIETEDAQRQLSLLALDLKEEEWKPTHVKHTLPERRRAAELLCNPPSDLTPPGKVRYRAATIDALVSLCRKQELPQKPSKGRDYGWGILPVPEPIPKHRPEPKPKPEPLAITNRQCIFCICKTGQSQEFCRPRKAREHVEKQHLRFFGEKDLIPCPDKFCRLSGLVLFGHVHFKNHVSRVHGCLLLPYILK